MTPIRLSHKDGATIFHYKPSELINFVRMGFKDGNVGVLLVKREDNVLTYKGFGTIENPCRHIHTISFVHWDLLCGKMPYDFERLIPPKPFFTPDNTRFILMDLGAKPIKTIQE